MRILLDAEEVQRGLRRVAGEICERQAGRAAGGLDRLVLVGIRRGGEPLAVRIASWIKELEGVTVPVASVDITLYRDDAATALPNPRIGPSHFPVAIDGKRVVLVDDVLHTRRTIRAALDAVLDFGRPGRIELAVLVDRPQGELPIQADYVVRRADDVGPNERIDVIEQAGQIVAVIQPAGAPSLPPPPFR